MIILLLIMILLLPSGKKQEAEVTKNDDTVLILPTKIPAPQDKEVLKSIKSRLYNTYKYKDITFDYAPNSDTVFVYYNADLDKAKQEAILFFKQEGVTSPEKINVFYVNLQDKNELPPHMQN